MEPNTPDLLALSPSERQFCRFVEQQHILKPKQVAPALKSSNNSAVL